jgi:hypothetical protein
VSPSITALWLLVALNAGGVLRVAAFQSNIGGHTVGIADGATSLTFEVEWKSDL